jgi:hypothetical protein
VSPCAHASLLPGNERSGAPAGRRVNHRQLPQRAPGSVRSVPCRHAGHDGVVMSRPRRGASTQPTKDGGTIPYPGRNKHRAAPGATRLVRPARAPVTHAHHAAHGRARPCSRPRASALPSNLVGGGRACHPPSRSPREPAGSSGVREHGREHGGGRRLPPACGGSPAVERAAAFI